jgi:hypothetical protein
MKLQLGPRTGTQRPHGDDRKELFKAIDRATGLVPMLQGRRGICDHSTAAATFVSWVSDAWACLEAKLAPGSPTRRPLNARSRRPLPPAARSSSSRSKIRFIRPLNAARSPPRLGVMVGRGDQGQAESCHRDRILRCGKPRPRTAHSKDESELAGELGFPGGAVGLDIDAPLADAVMNMTTS